MHTQSHTVPMPSRNRRRLHGASAKPILVVALLCALVPVSQAQDLGRQLEDAIRKGVNDALGGNAPRPRQITPPNHSAQQNQEARRKRLVEQNEARRAKEQAAGRAKQDAQRQAAENETYSADELREIERLSYSGPSRNRPEDLSGVLHAYRMAWSAPLNSYQTVPLLRTLPGFRNTAPIKGFHRVVCTYDANKNVRDVLRMTPESFHFWFRHRPADEIIPQSFWLDGYLSVRDVAVERCPATLGAAYELHLGADVVARAEQAEQDLKEYGKMTEAEREARRQERIRAANQGWDANPVANTPVRDLELARGLDVALNRLEGGGKGLSVEAFSQEVEQRIRPQLEELARSGLAKLAPIHAPLKAAGRKAFDQWDATVGGQVLLGMRRLREVRARYTNDRPVLGLSQLFGGGESDQERSKRQVRWQQGTNLDFLGAIEQKYTALYDKYLAGQPLLDRSYITAMKTRLNATPKARDAWRASVDMPPRSNRMADDFELMTLDELAAAEFGRVTGEGLGGAIGAMMQIGMEVAMFDARIRDARKKFWTCHAQNCADAARLYREYSEALRDKDMHYLVRPALQIMFMGVQGAVMQEYVLGQFGAGTIDGGGSVPDCGDEWDGANDAIHTHLRGWSPTAGSKNLHQRVARFMLSPEYGKWQQCRDRQEFLYRVRPI